MGMVSMKIEYKEEREIELINRIYDLIDEYSILEATGALIQTGLRTNVEFYAFQQYLKHGADSELTVEIKNNVKKMITDIYDDVIEQDLEMMVKARWHHKYGLNGVTVEYEDNKGS